MLHCVNNREMLATVNLRLGGLSAVALMKRLRKSGSWLHALHRALFEERGTGPAASGGFEVRGVDATTVKESGKTG